LNCRERRGSDATAVKPEGNHSTEQRERDDGFGRHMQDEYRADSRCEHGDDENCQANLNGARDKNQECAHGFERSCEEAETLTQADLMEKHHPGCRGIALKFSCSEVEEDQEEDGSNCPVGS